MKKVTFAVIILLAVASCSGAVAINKCQAQEGMEDSFFGGWGDMFVGQTDYFSDSSATYWADTLSQGSQSGGTPTSSYVDSQGNPIFQNGDGSLVAYRNGQYVPVTDNIMFDAQTSQQMAQGADGSFYYLRFDSQQRPYALSTDGSTRYYLDEQNRFYSQGANGERVYMTAGSSGSTAGSGPSSGSIQTDPSTGRITTFTSGSQSYRVDYSPSGMPYYTNALGQQVYLNGSTAGNGLLGGLLGNGGYYSAYPGVYDTTGGLLGGVAGSYLGSLLLGGNSLAGLTSGWLGSNGLSYGNYGATNGLGGYSGLGGLTSAGGLSTGGMGNLPMNVGLPSGTIQGVVATFLMWLLGIFGLLALISFIVSGIMYFMAMGDDRAVEKAKNQIKWSIIGVIVGLAGLIIVNSVTTLFSGGSYF